MYVGLQQGIFKMPVIQNFKMCNDLWKVRKELHINSKGSLIFMHALLQWSHASDKAAAVKDDLMLL